MITGNCKPIEFLEGEYDSVQKGTFRYSPVEHSEVYEAALFVEKTMKWKPTGIECAISKDTLSSFVALKFEADTLPELGRKLLYSFGVYNSNTRHSAMKFYSGLVVNNRLGIVLDKIPIIKRNSNYTEFQEVLHQAMVAAKRMMKGYPTQVSEYKKHSINNEEAELLIMQAGREGILPWSRIGKMVAAWHRYADKGHTNLWRLICSFSMAAKTSKPLDQPNQILAFVTMIEEYATERKKQHATTM